MLLIYLVAAWLVGILLATWLGLPAMLFPLGSTIALVMVLLCWRQEQMRLVGLLLLAVLLGGWRANAAQPTAQILTLARNAGETNLTIRGVIAAEPLLRDRGQTIVVQMQALRDSQGWRRVGGLVQAFTTSPDFFRYGDGVELRGNLELPPDTAGKAYREYLNRQGIYVTMQFARVRLTAVGGGLPFAPLYRLLFALREWLSARIEQSVPEPEAGLLAALLLSIKSKSLSTVLPDFITTGTLHILVLSGFKVTLVAGIIAAGARRFAGWRGAALVGLSGIWLFTLLNGATPGALRAATMGSLLIFAGQVGRQYHIYTALAFAAFLLTLHSPQVLWDVGFQLSFSGTLGIILFAPTLQFYLETWLKRIPLQDLIAENIGVTVAAQVATAPVSAFAFHELSLVAPLANVLVVPFLSLLLVLGALTSLLGQLPLLGGIIASPTYALLLLTLQAIHWCADLPFADLRSGNFDAMLVWCYYVFLAIGAGMVWPWLQRSATRLDAARKGTGAKGAPTMENAPVSSVSGTPGNVQKLPVGDGLKPLHASGSPTLRLVLAGTLVAITLLGSAWQSRPVPAVRIDFLAAGKGQAVFLSTPEGRTVLLDGGDSPAATLEALGRELPFWQRSLDVVILTNPRRERVAGLLAVLERYRVGQAIDGGVLAPASAYVQWYTLLKTHGIALHRVVRGQTIQPSPALSIEVLSPSKPLHTGAGAEDDNSLVLRVVTRNLTILLASQAGPRVQQELLDSGLDLSADVLQVGRSHADDMPLAAFVQRVHPRYLLTTWPTGRSARPEAAQFVSSSSPAPSGLLPQPGYTLRTLNEGVLPDDGQDPGEMRITLSLIESANGYVIEE